MSTAGLVLGITGLVFVSIGFPFLQYFSSPLTILFVVVGLPLSGAAFYQARTDGTSLIIPLAGLATNAGALVFSTLGGWFLLGLFGLL